MSTEQHTPATPARDADLAGAEAAMHRAARVARRRAEAAAENTGAPKRTTDISDGTRTAESQCDPRALTFSQARGYEGVPRPLELEELPREARVEIWNKLYECIEKSCVYPDSFDGPRYVGGDWAEILRSKHLEHDIFPLDELQYEYWAMGDGLRSCMETLPFNKVFDLIQFILRHPSCPPDLAAMMKGVFSRCRLAYTIDEGEPPTIVPAVTPEEGRVVVEALHSLREAGLDGAASHLRNASKCVNAGDWAGSVRESIHAVESVARQLDPDASRTLGPALASIEKRGTLHTALKDAFNKLYGYTSDEQGVRHALLDRPNHNVGTDEALFMLGACASFASYLWRKHMAGEAPRRA